jgi:formylglycine-generating enzyme required for sulfatase activity
MADMEARLPTETEWELASQRISGMGNAWEWCADPFIPLQFVNIPVDALKAVGSPERSLRRASSFEENRASLPPDFSSPMVNFRPVIALKSHE